MKKATQKETEDPLFDFGIIAREQSLDLVPGPTLPESAKNYLNSYLSKTTGYKNISLSPENVCFSLYQPPPTSGPGKRALYFRLKRKFSRLRAPAVATIGVTRLCQCHCTHCSADYHMNDSEPELDTDALSQAAIEAVELGVTNVILLGGEPLLKKDLEKIIAAVNKNQAIVTMFTNGEFLSPQKCKMLKAAGLFGLFVSIDAADPEEHNQLRKRKDLFEKACQGILNARAAGLQTAISSYLTTEVLDARRFETMMELGRKLNADEVTFFDAISVGRMKNGASTFLTLEDRHKINRLTRFYRKDPNFPAVAPQSTLTSECGSAFCFAANTQFYLSSTGEFCPCDFTPLTIGKYPQQSIADLWRELITTDFYKTRSKTCRMQDSEFRKKTIERIPDSAKLPYSIEKLLPLTH